MDKDHMERTFARARAELYFPPCNLAIATVGRGDTKTPPFYVTGSTVYINPGAIGDGEDAERFLLSVMRHEISHIHYCPYDIRTAHGLIKKSYDVTGDWDLSFFTLMLFSDLTVDCLYMKRRFAETPFHLSTELREKGKGDRRLVEAAYRILLPDLRQKSYPSHIELAARDIRAIMSSGKDWYSKVSMLSKLILKMRRDYGMRFRLQPPLIPTQGPPIAVREDLYKDSISEFSDVFGSIKEREEAKAFYRHWIEPRLGERGKEELERAGNRLMSSSRQEAKKSVKGGQGAKIAKNLPLRPKRIDLSTPEQGDMEEPNLPTMMSHPYVELSESILKEAMWKVFWYRSRARRILLRYLEEGRRPEPRLSITRYPDDWTAEDDIEELDLEASLDEGPLMAEVNMLKWVEEARGQGHSFTIRRAPSNLVVLDASKSMTNIVDEASTSAMVAYMAARRTSGLASVITFSTNFISKGWLEPELEKMLTLSLSLGEFTILPVHEISRAVDESSNPVAITLITDCGWQNIEEALTELKAFVNRGNHVTVFYLRGGDYPKTLSTVASMGGVRIIEVQHPEEDLENIVVSETVKRLDEYIVNTKYERNANVTISQ